MKTSAAILGAFAYLCSAHADPRDPHAGAPQLMGARQFLSQLKARNALPAAFSAEHLEERHPVHSEIEGALEERQGSTGRCGKSYGTCAASLCCSLEGYCGTGPDYCAAPDCQFLYGPKCDANQIPAGASTASIARPLVGNVEYGGVGVYDCVVPGDVAFTFDDGPYTYTSDLLDKFKAYNAKATFFITGNNLGKGPIDSTPQWSNVIKRMVAEGHQVASHTWSHQDLVTLDSTQFKNQMVYNEMAFRNILGFFPTYMRPPYSSCDSACSSKLKTLGYHVTYFDVDTAGYLNDDVNLIQNSKNIWDAAINPSNPATDSFLEIEHDIHYQTVYNLTDYILASMYKHGYKSVTVGECLGDPVANWYRAGGGATVPVTPTSSTSTKASTSTKLSTTSVKPASTGPTSTKTSTKASTTTTAAKAISTDGSCSSTITCIGSTFGSCCSQYGWCGKTTAYCGTGCQPAFGTCK